MMDNHKLLLFILLSMINLVGFIICGLDKSKAKRGQWRIRERTIFILAFLGAACGILMGMLFFRHKTKHIRFILGIPIIILVQLALAYYIYIHFLI